MPVDGKKGLLLTVATFLKSAPSCGRTIAVTDEATSRPPPRGWLQKSGWDGSLEESFPAKAKPRC
jgi:hypothetical protein